MTTDSNSNNLPEHTIHTLDSHIPDGISSAGVRCLTFRDENLGTCLVASTEKLVNWLDNVVNAPHDAVQLADGTWALPLDEDAVEEGGFGNEYHNGELVDALPSYTLLFSESGDVLEAYADTGILAPDTIEDMKRPRGVVDAGEVDDDDLDNAEDAIPVWYHPTDSGKGDPDAYIYR